MTNRVFINVALDIFLLVCLILLCIYNIFSILINYTNL